MSQPTSIQADTRPAGDTGSAPGSPRNRIPALAVLGVVVLALLFRLAYLQQVRDPVRNPFFDDPSMDSRHYDRLATEYADGDWIGEGVYWYSPLYPYFLAVLYTLFGRDFDLVAGVQLLLGALHCGLVVLLGWRIHGLAAGIVAGTLVAIYGVGFYYEALLLKDGLSALLMTSSLLALLVATQGPREGSAQSRNPGARSSARDLPLLGVGLLLGISSLTSGTMVLLTLVAVFVLLVSLRPFPRLRPVMALALGFSLVLVPCTIRNAVAGGDLVPISYNAGPVFYTGNCPFNLNGSQIDVATYLDPANLLTYESENEEAFFSAYARRHLGDDARPSEVSSFWFRKGLAWVVANPLDWAHLTLKKIAVFFNDYEVPNNQSFELFRRKITPLLGWPLPTFGILAGLGLLGMAVALRRPRFEDTLAIGFFTVFSLSIILNFVVSRYRYPVTGILAVYAGQLIMRIVRGSTFSRILLSALAVGAIALLHLPVSGFDRDFSEENRLYAKALLRKGRRAEAEQSLREAIARNDRSFTAYRELGFLLLHEPGPPDPLRLREAQELLVASAERSPTTVESRTSLYSAALAALKASSPGDALQLSDSGLLTGEDCRLYFTRAMARQGLGDEQEARSDLDRALALEPGYLDALREKGRILATSGDAEGASSCFARILLERRGDERIQATILDLVAALLGAGDEQGAVRLLEGIRGEGRDEAHLLNEEAWILATARSPAVRDLSLAETLARRAVASLPLEPRFLDTLSESLFRQGKRQEASATIERALQKVGDDPELLSYLQGQKRRFHATSEDGKEQP